MSMAVPRARPGGGNKLQAALGEATLMIHCPPDIPSDAEIMGVCAVPKHLSGRNKYDWIAHDFLVWKSLFCDVGNPAFQVSIVAGMISHFILLTITNSIGSAL